MIFRFTIILAGVVCLALTAPEARGDAAGRIEDHFDATFRLLEQADAARAAGKTDDARRLYGATIATYQELAAKYPTVQSELVRFRVAYCKNQIIALLTDQNRPAADDAAAAPQTAGPPPTPTPRRPVDPAVAQGLALCSGGQFEAARHAVAAYCAAAPDDPIGLLVQATASLGLGENETAVALLKRVVAAAPDLREAHYNLAQLLVRTATPDFETARRHYQESIRRGGARDEDLEAVLGLE